MSVKWLLARGVDGPPGGNMALFFDGIYGLILLAALTFYGEGLQLVEPLTGLVIVIGGVFTSMALVLVNYGMANGTAGIAFSCANSFPAWHVTFNWMVLGQAISPGQLFGVALAIVGGIVISVNEQILSLFPSDDSQVD